MGMNFTEILGAAKAGYKPNEIIELNALTEKYEKEDILTLVSAGYNLDDLKKTVELADKFAEGASGQDKPQENNKTEENTGHKSADTSEKDPEGNEGSIDYKSLYEQEKKLREDMQHDNAKGDASGSEPKKTDEEIALEIANEILH